MSDRNVVVDVRHEPALSRFVVRVDGQDAGFADYVLRDGVRDFNHTVVDGAFRGRGLSAPLIQAALDDCRAVGVRVRPSCSAVAHFVAKNPEYSDLIV